MNRIYSLLPIAALTLASTPGCMLSPTDGETLATRQVPVDFEGFDTNPLSSVQVLVHNPSSNAFDPLTVTRTGNTPYSYDGSTWYRWSISTSLPTSYWRLGRKGGYFAKVRSRRPGGSNLYSVRSDWEDCQTDNPSVGAFTSNCTSDQSPNANIYTADFPATFDLMVDDLIFTPSGTTFVVHNAGRAGRITRADCAVSGRILSTTLDQRVDPGQTVTFRMSFVPSARGQRVTCSAFGEDLEGRAEPVSCGSTCGDNTRSELF